MLLNRFAIKPHAIATLVVVGGHTNTVGVRDLRFGSKFIMKRSVKFRVLQGIVGEVFFKIPGARYVVFLALQGNRFQVAVVLVAIFVDEIGTGIVCCKRKIGLIA